MNDNNLQIVISAKDEASSVINSFKNNAKELGAGFLVVGSAITGALALAVKVAADSQEKMASVNATLNTMTNRSFEVSTGLTQTITNLKVIGMESLMMKNAIENVNLSIKSQQQHLSDLANNFAKGKITSGEYQLKQQEIKNTIEALTLKIQDYNEKLGQTDTKQIEMTKSVIFSGEAIAKIKEKIITYSDAMQRLGFDNDDTAISVTQLFQKTGDLNRAFQLNQLAMDLSSAKNINLGEATSAVSKALSGQTKGLQMYLPIIKDGMTGTEALAIAQKNLAGQSEEASKTFNVLMKYLGLQIEDLGKKIGGVLIPILSKFITNYLIPIINKITEWIKAYPELTKQIVIITGVVGIFMTVLGGLLLALPALAIAFFVLTSPIGLVALAITGLIALGALIILNWQKVSGFFKALWEDIKTIFKNAIDAVMSFLQPLINAINTVIGGITSVAGKVGGAIGGAFNAVGSFITGKRASGGSVMAGGTYLVGEQGAELFTPSSNGYISPNGAGGGITININGGTYLSQDVARQIGNSIIDQFKKVARI